MKYNYLFNNNSGKGSFGFNLSETFTDESSFDDVKTILIAKLNEVDIDNISLIGKQVYLMIDFTILSVSETSNVNIVINSDTILITAAAPGDSITSLISKTSSGALYTKVTGDNTNQLKLRVDIDKAFIESGKLAYPLASDIAIAAVTGTATKTFTVSYSIV